MNKLKILFVEDDPLYVMLYYEIHKQEDYKIITAADGMEALQQVKKETLDTVILDWNIPRLDGIEVLKVLKNTEKTKDNKMGPRDQDFIFSKSLFYMLRKPRRHFMHND